MAQILGALALAVLATAPADGASCGSHRVTGYVRTEHSPWTYDGTSIFTDEAIAAAGWDIPIDSVVEIEDVGTFRVADRGWLAPGQIDVAVWSRAEAFALTGWRVACISAPGGAP